MRQHRAVQAFGDGEAMRLIAENLGGERGGETVFSGIGFALGEGEALVVTGPNGSGKSTLLGSSPGCCRRPEAVCGSKAAARRFRRSLRPATISAI